MIYYLGWYKSNYIDDYKQNANNAGSFKMGYVIRKIKQLGKQITVVSCCVSDKKGYVPLREVKVDENHTEHYLPSLKLNGFFRKFTALFRKHAIKKYLLKNVNKDDTLIVYHALGLDKILKKAKAKKKFKLILEVEEIYHVDATLKNQIKAKKQEQNVISIADAYIVVNDLIYDKYIANGKPHTVLYGVYDGADSDSQIEMEKGFKHVLFSGSIDKVRGAFLALDCAEYLSNDYILNISGGGSAAMVNELKEKIEQHNRTKEGAKIVYHGCLPEKELDALVNSCHIGLNLQDVFNPFEAVSFPSKITFYTLHGLNVVSTKMSSVIASKFSKLVNFAEYDAKEIAKTIKEIKIENRSKFLEEIKGLDKKALTDLAKLI